MNTTQIKVLGTWFKYSQATFKYLHLLIHYRPVIRLNRSELLLEIKSAVLLNSKSAVLLNLIQHLFSKSGPDMIQWP